MTFFCGYCGVTIEQHDGRGRPAKFCGVACRRLCESHLRRISRRLQDLDDAIGREERALRGIDHLHNEDAATRRLAALLAYRADIEADYEHWVRRSEGEIDVRQAITKRSRHPSAKSF